MIIAKISNLNPVQVTYEWFRPLVETWETYQRFQKIKVIADVENVKKIYAPHSLAYINSIRLISGKNKGSAIHFNQLCQIELTTEGKCKIIKLQ